MVIQNDGDTRKPPGQIVGYVRISTADQNEARQIEALGEVDKLFADKASGSTRKRPQLEACLGYLRSGDTLRVKSVDRLARSVSDLLDILSELKGRGIDVQFADAPALNTDTGMGSMVLTILGAIAQFELDMIHERQREGIALAKAQGKYERPNKLSPDQIDEARDRIAEGVPKARIARDLGVARSTLYDALAGRRSYAVGGDGGAHAGEDADGAGTHG